MASRALYVVHSNPNESISNLYSTSTNLEHGYTDGVLEKPKKIDPFRIHSRSVYGAISGVIAFNIMKSYSSTNYNRNNTKLK